MNTEFNNSGPQWFHNSGEIMSILKSKGLFKGTFAISEKSDVVNCDILSGKKTDGKIRYLSGSFIVTSRTKGLKEVLEKYNGNDPILVDIEVSAFYGEPSKCGKFVNYKGFIDSVAIAPVKEKA